jgi:hypothetical protein
MHFFKVSARATLMLRHFYGDKYDVFMQELSPT